MAWVSLVLVASLFLHAKQAPYAKARRLKKKKKSHFFHWDQKFWTWLVECQDEWNEIEHSLLVTALSTVILTTLLLANARHWAPDDSWSSLAKFYMCIMTHLWTYSWDLKRSRCIMTYVWCFVRSQEKSVHSAWQICERFSHLNWSQCIMAHVNIISQVPRQVSASWHMSAFFRSQEKSRKLGGPSWSYLCFISVLGGKICCIVDSCRRGSNCARIHHSASGGSFGVSIPIAPTWWVGGT